MDEEKTAPSVKGEDPGRGSIDDIAFQGTPGTRVLIDSHDADVVCLPRPTSSPDDPLNWSWGRKYTSLGIICLWTFMLGAATLSPAVTYAAVMHELGASVSYLNIGAALALLFLGLGNLLFNPLALKFGRRPVYLASALISAVSQVVTATAQSKATFLGGRILLGFGAAPFEQLPALTVDDQFFIHHRGFGLSLYTLAITSGSFLGPIATGFVVDSLGWRWVYWFYAIFLFSISLIIFLGLEESGFPRPLTTTQAPKTYLQKLKLFTLLPNPMTPSQIVLSPFKLLSSPLIWWCGIMYGFAIAWLTIMAYESTTVFTIYGFSSSTLGLTNIAPLLGGWMAIYLGGAGTDRFMVYRARLNGGIMEPETRIYSVFFAGPVMGAGLVLYGVGASRGVHWSGPIVGMGMIGAAIPIAAEVALGYASESFPGLAGEATTAVIVVRNVIGCGMTFAIGPWIERSGLMDTFVVVGVLALLVFGSGGVLIWKGKGCRGRGKEGYYAMVRMKQ